MRDGDRTPGARGDHQLSRFTHQPASVQLARNQAVAAEELLGSAADRARAPELVLPAGHISEATGVWRRRKRCSAGRSGSAVTQMRKSLLDARRSWTYSRSRSRRWRRTPRSSSCMGGKREAAVTSRAPCLWARRLERIACVVRTLRSVAPGEPEGSHYVVVVLQVRGASPWRLGSDNRRAFPQWRWTVRSDIPAHGADFGERRQKNLRSTIWPRRFDGGEISSASLICWRPLASVSLSAIVVWSDVSSNKPPCFWAAAARVVAMSPRIARAVRHEARDRETPRRVPTCRVAS